MATIPWPAGGNLQSLLAILGDGLAEASFSGGGLTITDVGQAELEAAAAAYEADEETHVLEPMRENRKLWLRNLTHATALKHYPQERQALFHMMLTEAIIDAQPGRISYIRQLATWIKTMAAAQIGAEAEVDLAATIEEIRAIEINFEPIEAVDPLITIKGALAITD